MPRQIPSCSPTGVGPSQSTEARAEFCIQRDTSAFHFDVYVDDLTAATARIEELGGGRWSQHGATVDDGGLISRIMTDPEGNEFCIALSPSKSEQWQADDQEVVARNEGRVAGAD
jgi:hypothetical protein